MIRFLFVCSLRNYVELHVTSVHSLYPRGLNVCAKETLGKKQRSRGSADGGGGGGGTARGHPPSGQQQRHHSHGGSERRHHRGQQQQHQHHAHLHFAEPRGGQILNFDIIIIRHSIMGTFISEVSSLFPAMKNSFHKLILYNPNYIPLGPESEESSSGTDGPLALHPMAAGTGTTRRPTAAPPPPPPPPPEEVRNRIP